MDADTQVVVGQGVKQRKKKGPNMDRPARFDREVKLVTRGKRLENSPERRAIGWFKELRRILLDPRLAEPDDLFARASPTDYHNHARLFPRFVGKPRQTRKEAKAEQRGDGRA